MTSDKPDNGATHFSGMIAKRMALLMVSTACVLAASHMRMAIAEPITGTITVDPHQYPYPAASNTGTAGSSVGNIGGNGQSAYVFNTTSGTTPDQNKVSINSGVSITGGDGGDGSAGGTGGTGGTGISGSVLTITNSGSITGGDGGDGSDGSDGSAGGTGISGSVLTITNESGGSITGGKGGDGGYGSAGGDGISGSVLTITNSSTIMGGVGGEGGDRGYGDAGGIGGTGISGSGLTITNKSGGSITGGAGGDGFGNHYGYGGAGGDGISGSGLTITNESGGSITGGAGGTGYAASGAGGAGGTGISGSVLTITNKSGGIITGGVGGSGSGGTGGDGGTGISGSGLTIKNSGSITGGAGRAGGDGDDGVGGDGGTGISGSGLTITNESGGSITGGAGGDGEGGDRGYGGYGGYGAGGTGGDGISGSALTIKNSGSITGGKGGYGEGGYSTGGTGAGGTGTGGTGGDGISGSGLKITNESGGSITGGKGGDGYGYGYSTGDIGGAGGTGGAGISGSGLTITNESGGSITGGKGGDGSGNSYGTDGIGGKGGTGGAGISGSALTITNESGGSITGGVGGDGSGNSYGTDGIGGKGGTGGAGISGSGLTITNESGGSITGGKGGDGSGNSYGTGGIGGKGGIGGAGISGSALTVTNSGSITGGKGGDGIAGAAIRLNGSENSLTLEDGSEITGDVVLSDMPDAESTNTLSIISNAATTITGNLTARAYTGVTLSGETVTFTGNASFQDNTSLTFSSFEGGPALKADSLSLNGTDIKGNISNWGQADYVLAETTKGVSGTYYDKTGTELLTVGAKNYAYIYTSNDGNDLSYGLKWNVAANGGEDAYGTFDLKQGATLTLGVVLEDNGFLDPAFNVHDWDGKSLTKDGLGTLILNASNAYTGFTTVSAGTLKTSVEDAFATTSGVTVSSDATLNLGGNSQTLSTGAALNNAGTVLINDWDAALLTSPVVITGDMVNSGLIVLNNCTTCAGQTLEVAGDWTSNGGTVSLGTVLGDDTSKTDMLVITGNATGTTRVRVANEGGSGAQTLEGIELITTGSSTSDAFVQDGRIIAGSYDYSLQQGNKSGAYTNNWYLTSKRIGDDTYRPEAGGYASNLAASATMFNLRLNDRQGEGYYVDRATGERRQSNIWLRYEGTHSQNQMVGGQLDNTANRTVFQMGGDLLGGSFNDNDLWRLGVTGGYGHQNTATRNNLSGYRTDAEMSGYSVGLYGTWYQNGQDHSGLYVDSWVLYNWFDNTIKGDDLRGEKYKSKGFSASIEGGYNFLAGTVNGLGGVANNVFIRPQGQVIWSGVKADGHTEVNGTEVSGLGDGNVQTRLGLRMSLSPVDRQASSYSLEPFIEASWLHNTKRYGVEMGGVSSFIEGSRNLGEIKLGLEGKFNDNFSAWGSLGHQMGSDSYRETKGVIGVKYRF